MRIADIVLAELEREGASTERMLERVPAEKLEWRPHEKSMTLGQLAYHIAEIPARITAFLAAGEFDTSTARPSHGSQREASPLELYRRNLAGVRAALQAMENDQLMQPFRMRRGDKVLMEFPKSGMVRTIFLNHSYHHRGQLSVYLRLLDVPLPAIYGTSADEPGA